MHVEEQHMESVMAAAVAAIRNERRLPGVATNAKRLELMLDLVRCYELMLLWAHAVGGQDPLDVKWLEDRRAALAWRISELRGAPRVVEPFLPQHAFKQACVERENMPVNILGIENRR